MWYFEHAYTSFRAQSFSHEQAETYASGVGGFDVTYRESTTIDISTDTKQSDVQIGTVYRDAIAVLVYHPNETSHLKDIKKYQIPHWISVLEDGAPSTPVESWQELPWILQDIANGQRQMQRKGTIWSVAGMTGSSEIS